MNKVLLKSDFDFDFILIAISCPLKDYRLCHFINKHTGLTLGKDQDHQVFIPQLDKNCRFSSYSCLRPDNETEFYLFANRGEEEGILVPEMKNTDYFMIIRNFIDDEDLTQLVETINSIPEVVVASVVAPVKLRSKENLIF